MIKKVTYRLLMGIMAAVVMLLTACSEDETQQNNSASLVQIVGRVPGFADYDVTTRAAKTPEESAIKYMTLLIYDNADRLINKQSIESSVPLFMIDRHVLSSLTTNGINSADMYMITNISEAEIDSWNTSTVSDLLAVTHEYNTASLNIPTNGFPMVGKMENVDLRPGYSIPDSKIEIPLENLFAKIVFNIRMELVQNINDPSFQLVSWEVHNLPKGFGLAGTRPDGQTAFYNNAFDNSVTSRRITGTNPITGANSLSFSFYMPEHKVNPAVAGSAYSYPSGIKDNEKQRYKPCLVDKEANSDIAASYDGEPTYVVINGLFTDHQKQQHEVAYKVYLGSDNWQNFQIERNGQYNNSIVICGITNFKDAEEGSVSIDHRVTLEKNEFTVQMERETLLDSHIEVRPVHIDMHNKAGVSQSLKVYLASPEQPNTPISSTSQQHKWVRLEPVVGAMNSAKYCSYTATNQTNKGRRKYFTTNLLNELNSSAGNGIQATFTDTHNTFWLYFDENTDVSTDGSRSIMLAVEYYENGSIVTSKRYTFEQHDLYPVIFTDKATNTEYRYDIEYYEEYLYNFNSDDDYNATRAGMPWGPNEDISYEIMAIQDVQSGWADNLQYIENAIKRAGGYYDFQNNFWGRKYTTKLIDIMNQDVLAQDAMPNSAAQHCHNKNKRKDNGEVESIQWYLPAIGELQHIMSAAYTKFDMFQENRYWSSQTSYRIGHFKYSLLWGILGSVEGDYYYEDHEYARATKAIYEGNNVYTYEPSEVQGISKTWTGSVTNQTGNFSTEVAPSSRDTGNRQRSDINRVRAVRNKYKRAVGSSTWTEIVTEE